MTDLAIEEGHLPSIDDCIESFLRLLENIYSKEKIADCLAEGLNAMEYSKKDPENSVSWFKNVLKTVLRGLYRINNWGNLSIFGVSDRIKNAIWK